MNGDGIVCSIAAMNIEKYPFSHGALAALVLSPHPSRSVDVRQQQSGIDVENYFLHYSADMLDNLLGEGNDWEQL